MEFPRLIFMKSGHFYSAALWFTRKAACDYNLQSKMAQFVLLASVLFWWTTNTLAVIYSKKSLETAPSGALPLTLAQHSLTAVLLWAYLGFLQWRTQSRTQSLRKKIWKWFPAGSFHAIGVLATNQSLTYLSTGQTQSVKGLEPLCLYVFSLCLTPSEQTLKEKLFTLGSIFVAVTGITISIYSSQSDEGHAQEHTQMELLPGVCLAAVSCIAFPLRNLWIKHKKVNRSTMTPLWNMALVSLWGCLLTAPCAIFVQAPYWGDSQLFTSGKDTAKSSIFHGLYHLTSVSVLSEVNPLLHSMLGVAKRIFVIIFSSLYFEQTITLWEVIGLNCFVLGFLGHKAATLGKSSLILNRAIKVTATALLFSVTYAVYASKGQHFRGHTPVVKSFQEKLLELEQSPKPPNVSITVAWTYQDPIPSACIDTLRILSNSSSEVHILCGSTACMKQVEDLRLKSSQVSLPELFQGLGPLQEWISKHPVNKVLARGNYEDHLAEAVRIAAQWKFAGLFVDIRYAFEPEMLSQLSRHSVYEMEMAVWKHNSATYLKTVKSELILQQAQKLLADYPNVTTAVNQHRLNNASSNVYVTRNSSAWRYSALGYQTRIKQQGGTANVGDEMQSIAGLHYLPYVDCLLERDSLQKNECTDKFSSNTSNMITFMNAWWGLPKLKWPPPQQVKPVFVSVHSPEEVMMKAFKPNIHYLKKHEPIGCRDTYTLDIMRKYGISSYFSGCLTLMLHNPVAAQPRNNETYIVDVKEEFINLLPGRIRSQAIRLKQDVKDNVKIAHSEPELFKEAFRYLHLYGSAKLVITSRVHSALPSVSLGTPVVFINSPEMPGGGGSVKAPATRVVGITDLFHTLDTYKLKDQNGIKNWMRHFNWDNPPAAAAVVRSRAVRWQQYIKRRLTPPLGTVLPPATAGAKAGIKDRAIMFVANPRPELLTRLRATLWDVMRSIEPVYDASIKFGTLPRQLSRPEFTQEPLLFHFMADKTELPSGGELSSVQWQSLESVLFNHPNSHVILHTTSKLDPDLFASLQESGYAIESRRYDYVGPQFLEALLQEEGGIYLDLDVLIMQPLYLLTQRAQNSSVIALDPKSGRVKLKILKDDREIIELKTELNSINNYIRGTPEDCQGVPIYSRLFGLWIDADLAERGCLEQLFHQYCILCNRVHSRLLNM